MEEDDSRIQRHVREQIEKIKNLYEKDILEELKNLAKPTTKEARMILEVMLSPDCFRVDHNNVFEEYSIACTPIACISDMCLLVFTYEGIKKGSDMAAFDPGQKNNLDAAISNARIPSDKLENLLISLGLKYRKIRNKTHYWYGISRDENHLKLYDLMYGSEKEPDDRLCGTFYDYPECCVETVCTRSKEDLRKIYDEFKKMYKSGCEDDILFASCFFLPCTTTCEKASKKGRDMLMALEKNYGNEFASEVKKYVMKFKYSFR